MVRGGTPGGGGGKGRGMWRGRRTPQRQPGRWIKSAVFSWGTRRYSTTVRAISGGWTTVNAARWRYAWRRSASSELQGSRT